MKKPILLIILSMLFLISLNPIVNAKDPVEDKYMLCDAWYSKDGQNWENTMASDNLKLGEPFYIKILVKAKKPIQKIYYSISSLGDDPDFDLVESATLEDNAELMWIKPNGSTYVSAKITNPIENHGYYHIWKLRVNPNSEWAGGNTALNIDSQYVHANGGDTLQPFTALSVNILDETWEGYNQGNNNDGGDSSNDYQGTPGFELILFTTALFLAILIHKKRK